MTQCAVSDCTVNARKRGLCGKHYQRWWKYGRADYAKPSFKHCTVAGCDTALRSKFATMCEMHYCRVRRNGHLDPLARPEPQECAVRDCTRRAKNKGHCGMHAERVRRHCDPHVVLYRIGDTGTLHPSWRGAQITYSAAHMRTRAERGTADRYLCIDCTGPAEQWSYDHGDPDALRSEDGLLYSPDPTHYQPRCRTCHVRFDRQHAETLAG